MNNDIRFELPEINTWRLFNKGISQDSIIEMIEGWESHGYRFGTVCIDDGWTMDGKLGDWRPDPKRFHNFAGLIEWIRRRGYAVRLWVAPVQIHQDTDIFKKAYPDAVLKDAENRPAFYTGLGTYRLDPRTETGSEHIRATMQRLVCDYGVDAFKVDFPPFYRPDDEFYKAAGFNFSEHDKKTMVSEFYRLIRESLDAIKPGIRIECARDLPNCQPYINDTICGDLVGHERTFEYIEKIAARLRNYSQGYDIVPWLEMIWGEGSDCPARSSEWHAGFLEWIAMSINFGLKIEHSFLPFSYPNEEQIRCLTNLYGPRNTQYKVLHAGRKTFSVKQMMDAGIELDSRTRFLVAPEDDTSVVLHTASMKTNAIYWKCRNVLSHQNIILRARNEFWGDSTDWCQVSFEADRHQVYELWYDGVESRSE